MLSFLRDADVLDAWLSSQRNKVEDEDSVNLELCEKALAEVENQQNNAVTWSDKIKQLRIQTKVKTLYFNSGIRNIFLFYY